MEDTIVIEGNTSMTHKLASLRYDIETLVIVGADPDHEPFGGFPRIRRGVLTRLKCKKCGNVVHEEFTPAGHLPPLLDDKAIPDYSCDNCRAGI